MKSKNKPKDFKMKVEIKKLPNMKVAYVRHIGPYMKCEKAWGKLITWAHVEGLINDQTVYIGICHDDPEVTEADKIRFDAAISPIKDSKAEGEVGIKEIKEDICAMAVHKGPYEDLYKTYAYICGKWAVEQNVEIRSVPSIEIYKNDPHNTLKENLITEVYVPIIK